MAITKIIAIINSGIALKKTVIVLAIKKTTIFGAIFFAESKASGIDKTIAIKVPSIAISIVSIIEYINSLKLEKSGGNILEKISEKYLKESVKRLIKLISRSIVTTVSNTMVEIIKIIVFQDHWGLKYFSKFSF
tara:strand:- start:507 stop:908 length:402 start_codon:yes stop_codon:yes gene_type:complete